MKSLGYYAKDANGTLFQFEWIKNSFTVFVNGFKAPANPNDFEVLEIGFFTADDEQKPSFVPSGYQIFTMVELAKNQRLIDSQLELDSTWEIATELYYEFSNSSYDDDNKPEIECIIKFLENKIVELLALYNLKIGRMIHFEEGEIESDAIIKFIEINDNKQGHTIIVIMPDGKECTINPNSICELK